MKIPFTDLEFAAASKNGTKVLTGIAGSDSQNLTDDPGGPDLNLDLTGRAKYEIYREMTLSDPAVRSVEFMFTLTIRSANWGIEAASEDKEDELIAQACAAQCGIQGYDGFLDQPWDATLSQALLYLRYGSMWEEIIWGDPIKWEKPTGGTMPIRPITRLGPRYPSTIDEIETDKFGNLAWIKQDVEGAKKIPAEKLVYFILDQEGAGSWFGTSLLRAMYGPWRMKKALMIGAAIAFDRYASGVPVIRYPSGSSESTKVIAERIGQNLRTHERAWVALEGTSDPSGGGWDVSILNGSSSIADPVPLLRHYDEQIAAAGIQGFTRLGVTETGSRAVGEVLADPYYLAVQSVAKYVGNQRRRQMLRRFVDVNFGEDKKLPKITVSKIQARNVEGLAQTIASLRGAGFDFSDPEIQDELRDQMDLPRLPDKIREAMEKQREEQGTNAAPEGDAPPEF